MSTTGELKIGDLTLACAVLEDGTRVLSQGTVLRALGRNPEKSHRTRGSSPDVRAPFLLANNLQRFISDELRELAEQPVRYRVHGESGTSWGYDAYMLPGLCEVYMEARRLDTIARLHRAPRVLFKSQEPAADAAETLFRGLARVGIIAAIDEATGYQEVRARHELEQILAAYVQAELRPWIRTFPDEFFREIYRLQGWDLQARDLQAPPLRRQAGQQVHLRAAAARRARRAAAAQPANRAGIPRAQALPVPDGRHREPAA